MSSRTGKQPKTPSRDWDLLVLWPSEMNKFVYSWWEYIIIISLCESTAERRPFPTPSATAYLGLLFARLFLLIFQSRRCFLYQAFFASFIVIRVPVSLSLRPSTVVHPRIMYCPPLFLLFDHLYNDFYFSLFSNPGWSFYSWIHTFRLITFILSCHLLI